MSVQAYTWVLDVAPIPNPTPEGMPPASSLALVLLGLANHAGPDGCGAYPSKGTLARYSRLSERQVQRCLGALAELGLIVPGDPRIAALYARDGYRPNVWDLPISGETSCLPSAGQGRQSGRSGETDRSFRGDMGVSQTVLKPTTNRLADSGESALPLEVVSEVKPKRRATTLPGSWAPSAKHFDLARELGLSPDRVDLEGEQFRDRALAKGERYIDWDAAFRTWLRNSKKFADRANAGGPARSERRRDPKSGMLVER